MIVIAGVSGSGKTTTGALLADALGWHFADADEFHPAANIAKMAAGIPLTDDDRQPWLRAIAAWLDEHAARGEQAVVTCSALKRSYRDMLLAGRPDTTLVFLDVDRALLARRLAARHGHFFPGGLLGSQLAELELPGPAERALVIRPVGQPAQTVTEIIAATRGLASVASPAGSAYPAMAEHLS